MPLLIDRNVLLNEMESAIYEGPSPDAFNNDVELATGVLRIHADISEVSDVVAITTIGEAEIAKLATIPHWSGTATSAISDGAITNPITIDGESVTAKTGDIVQYQSSKFIFNGTKWQELGTSVGTLKTITPADFAYTTTTAVNAQPECITEIRSIDDIVKEKMDEYRELMRLQALGCKNCGGSINRETMTCEYCGTGYRN